MTEGRDYDLVTWPWEHDPNWAAPREGATSDPGEDENWRLSCAECELHFPKDIPLGTVEAHWTELHHPEQADEPKLALNLVWVGLGTPPKAGS